MQILIWILAAIAAYRLWEDYKWLSIIVILLAISFGLHPDEARARKVTGQNSNPAAMRLAWTAVLIGIVFVVSLFI